NDQAQARRVGGGRMLATFTSTVKDLPVVLKIFQNLWVYARKRGMLEVLSKPVSFCDKNRAGHNEVPNSLAWLVQEGRRHRYVPSQPDRV
ncbi:hypothetical protein MYX75_04680, partial [Acidobacteria bacterium AH-259-A15]|nr:hypothetical protein [Acidobacteria bacterium AH-259-A15]